MPTVAANRRKLLIGGQWTDTQEALTVRSPYDGSEIAQVAWGNRTHAEAAIDAAEQAMAQPLATHLRIRILEDVAVKLKSKRGEFARTIALEAAKPIAAAEAEVDRAVQTLLFSVSAARTSSGELVNLDAHPAGEGRLGMVVRVPAGIVAAITPFNFPLNLVVHKMAPAFAAGCAVVLKPADKTPVSALLMGEIFVEAGTPPGWINIVVGDAEEIGDAFLRDERIKVISFTGSAEVGWRLRANAPKKKVLLELGNATPLIVLADADLGLATAAIAAHGFGFAGQTCISIQRVYAERSICNSLLEQLIPKINQLILGDPLNPNTQVGPVITEGSRDRLLSWIRAAELGGAVTLAGGELNERGMLLPTLLTDVAPEMDLCSREVFGPVVSVIPVSGLDEAVALANSTPYGLQAGLFTKDVARALVTARSLQFAGVTINESPSFRADNMPYGGIKDSGNTREGPQYAFEEYTERRLIVVNLSTS